MFETDGCGQTSRDRLTVILVMFMTKIGRENRYGTSVKCSV